MSNDKHTRTTPSNRTAYAPFAIFARVLAELAARLRLKGSSAPNSGHETHRNPMRPGRADRAGGLKVSAPQHPRRSGGRAALALCAALLGLLAFALPAAQADETFGIKSFDVSFTDPGGAAVTQAGSHPYEMSTSFQFNLETLENGDIEFPEPFKDIDLAQIAGLIGNPSAVPTCSSADFLSPEFNSEGIAVPQCADSSAVGVVGVEAAGPKEVEPPLWSAVFSLTPPPGTVAKFGFFSAGVPVTITFTLRQASPYNIVAHSHNVSQVLKVGGVRFDLWGIPADPAHDSIRGKCVHGKGETPLSSGNCPAGIGEVPLLTLPAACPGPLGTEYALDSWTNPGAFLPDGEADLADPAWVSSSVLTHDSSEPPLPQGMIGCSKAGFAPETTAQPTSEAASSPTGLDFSLDQDRNEGLLNPSESAISDALVEKAVVTLPEGMSVNPSQAEGLAVCTEAQLAQMTPFTGAGTGCPQASKIGTVEAETPVLPGKLMKGSLFVAKPYENPFDSLIALYIVVQNPELGIKVVQPLRVETDPQTGRVTTVAEEIIPQPLSHFRLHFREGTRSPLATPPTCGTHTMQALLYPSSGGPPVPSPTSFQIISGPGGGPCPAGGLPSFHPELQAGTVNNAAGRFSPFDVRITRSDSEQEITHFSIKLPPGVAGKLAGIPLCSDAAIAAATARTGPHGGQEELESPSCPAASQVGRTLAGAGVGPSLAYAPGKLYLAGPYHGAPVSIVSITAGVVGPFDIGTVVVRLAVQVNPETGEVFLDSTGSDPIPHIIKGIPVHLRDIRAYTDRPEFTFNPTSCEPSSTSATVLGSGLDFVSSADDNPFVSTSRFQAADCAALPFKPKLTLTLKGSTKRGGNPALHAHLAMKGISSTGANEAGVAYAQVALPNTEFLDNAHVGGPCTQKIFREGLVEGEKCPPSSVIGTAKAVTPILDAPLEGPVYLRTNPERNLPDIAAALRGSEISVVLVGHTDSAKGGGLRNTFEVVPDAPVSSFDLNLFGGNKGLLENSPKGLANTICGSKLRATTKFTGHSGKTYNHNLALKVPGCKKANKKHRRP